ncbi:hypothetical protein GGF32_006194 [Allomyces javanicus]|nr:hypothetical protein GGF32_006194 [Allomyces javanicus]
MSTFQCSATRPCRSDLCCSADGYCSSTAAACDRAAGCQSGCKLIPSPTACQTQVTVPDFQSTLFNPISRTGTTSVLAPNGALRPAGASCVPTNYALAPCDLVDAMGGAASCPYCLFYYDAVREAFEAYDFATLDCALAGSKRAAAFLAQMRHETGYLRTLYQPLDGGSGAFHVIPMHFPALIAGIPRLAAAVAAELPWTNVNEIANSVTSNSTLQRMLGLIIQRPEHAFLTAGFWLTEAAAARLDSRCGDLRVRADEGIGVYNGEDHSTGYYEISRCIFGSLRDDYGLTQRVQAYKDIAKYTTQYSASYVRTPPALAAPPTPTPAVDWTTLGIVIGVTIIAVFLADRLSRYLRRTGRIRPFWLKRAPGPATATVPVHGKSKVGAEVAGVQKSGKRDGARTESRTELNPMGGGGGKSQEALSVRTSPTLGVGKK